MAKNNNKYILYIEDERPIRELVSHALRLSGYEVVGVSSGEEGLQVMRQRKPHVLLLDLMMPGISGWDVYRAMKTDESLANIPVVVVTAKVPKQGYYIVDELPPVENYITKPFDVEQLIRSVQNFM